MLAWTWGTWPDVLVDFGGEIYVAWRLAEGDVLYRDLAYFTGPLSPYWNTAVFGLFGVSLRVLVLANLASVAGISVLMHGLLARIAGRLAAAVALLVFLALFAFAQLEILGNSNYVCPYSHETVHGALIALAGLSVLGRWLADRRPVRVVVLGLLLGLAFLTKVEIFVAFAAASLLGLGLGFAGERRGIGVSAAALLGAAALPVLGAFLLLSTAMESGAAWRGTLGAWPHVTDDRITSLEFYRWVMGTDRPGENLGRMLAESGRWLALLGPAAVLAALWRRRTGGGGGTIALLAGIAAGAGVLAALRLSPDAWLDLGRPLPLVASIALAGLLAAAWRSRSDAGERDRWILGAAFAVFALGMLSKMILHARINMYGYSLAMPATMLAVAALVGWVPAALERRGRQGSLFRGVAVGVLAVAGLGHLAIMRGYLAHKTVTVGEGADSFLADARGTAVNAAVAAIRERARPGATLAAMPEGVMLNYLARLRAPARYFNYMPPEVLMFGEDVILADLSRSPPDLVAIVHKSTAEYGLPWFGRDYAQGLMAFVRERYAPGPRIGGEPLQPGTGFGIRLLERAR